MDGTERGSVKALGPRARRGLLAGLVLGVVALLAGVMAWHLLAPPWLWRNEACRSTAKALGALTAVLTSLVLLQRGKDGADAKFSLPALGLLGMGILDGFHAAASLGKGFVLPHCAAGLAGAIGFACVWLEGAARWASRRRWLAWAVGCGAGLLGAWTLIFRASLPPMVRDGQFTTAAVGMNVAAGALFLVAGVRFAFDFGRRGRLDSYVLACMSALFGLAGLLFQWSAPWDGDWWAWHVLRLGAYLPALGFVFHGYLEALRRRRDELEELVAQRTDELRAQAEVLCRSEREARYRNAIAEIFLTVPDKEMYGEVLQVVLASAGSRYGVFGYIDERGSLVVPSMTRDMWDQCDVADKRIVYPRETWGDSLWPRAIREKRTLYSNEPSTRTPAGHIAISRNLAVPILHRGEVIGLFHVANKASDYDADDAALLGAVAGRVAPILSARLQRDRLEEARAPAEKELKQTVDDLARSNRELEQFAYVASHDLQEPLRMVASYTQLLAQRYEDKLDDDARDFIRYAVDGANRMQRLINDLLSYSRVSTRGRQPEGTDSRAALGEAIANLAAAVDEAGALVTNDDLPTVRADATQLVQVFQNLIHNAVKFRADQPPRVHVSARREGDKWVFSVRDNGIGIAPEYHERIFQIFQRLHGRDKYGGTGIGLALCKGIVERHRGKIWVESEVGKGSTFCFSLPA